MQPAEQFKFPATALDSLAAGFNGRAGIYVKDLTSGDCYAYCADERFPTASVFKVSVMVALYQQAEAGRIDLDERRRVEPNICTHGTGHLSWLRDSPQLTLRDFCRLMIGVSDNIATDMLVRALGTDAINRMLDDLGLTNTRVPMEIGRWHYTLVGMGQEPINRENDERQLALCKAGLFRDDGLGYSDSLENLVTSPRDMGVLLECLHRGKLAGPQSTAAMIEMLRSSSGMIKSALQDEVAKNVASKKGASRRIKADVGIVYLGTAPLIVCAFTLEQGNTGSGRELIEDITRLVAGALISKKRSCD